MFRTGRERVRFEPKSAGHNSRIYSYLPPPRGFITTAVHLAMMPSAQWNCELIADLATECSALCEAQVMRIRGLATANQASLFGHMSDMLAVANPAWLRQGQDALIDYLRSRPVLRRRFGGAPHCQRLRNLPCPLLLICIGRRKARQSRLEALLHDLRIGCRHFILFNERPVRPDCGIIGTGQNTDFSDQSIA
jgi:hypothetical protein